MNKLLAITTIATLPLATYASTKYLECEQSNEDETILRVKVGLDNSAKRAEVLMHALTAECAKTDVCRNKLYRKEVLPSIIRLTSLEVISSSVSYSAVIDINRKNLNITTVTNLKGADGDFLKHYKGSCKIVNSDQSENLI